MTQELPYAGLILPCESGLEPTVYLKAAQHVLNALDPHDARPAKINPTKLAVFGAQYGLRFKPLPQSDLGPKMRVEIMVRGGDIPNEEFAAKILSDTVLEALKVCDADVIEWYAPDVLIDAADFIRLRNYVSPRRSIHFGDIEEVALSDQFRVALYGEQNEDPEDSDMDAEADLPAAEGLLHRLRARIGRSTPGELRLGAASWAITGALALVALPVAAALFVVGLLRGMDFRLATQALSVTMLFVALENSDSLNRLLALVIY